MGREKVLIEPTRPFVRGDCLRDAIIYEIVELEWNQLKLYRGEQGRPLTEDEFESFYQVRYSQHSAMNSDTLGLYRSDLNVASHTGRNLMAEKYAYMQHPDTPLADPQIAPLLEQVAEKMLASHERFAAAYPALAAAGRGFDPAENTVSAETYIRSELLMKSDVTLQMLERDVRLNPDYIKDIFTEFIHFFGQTSLEQAEVLAASRTMKPCRG